MKHLAATLSAAILSAVALAAPPMILPAQARIALEKSDPASGATVKTVPRITLHFSGDLEPARSGATLISPAGKILPVSTSVGMHQITLLTFQLAPGHYQVKWHGESPDQSKAKGSIAFTVNRPKAGMPKKK